MTSKPLHFVLALAACAWLAAAGRADAAAWTLAPGLLSEAAHTRMTERYPDVRDASELEALLRDIGRRAQLLRLEARFQGGRWMITGALATTIADVEVELVTRELRQPVTAATQAYVGQVDSPEIRAKIQAVLAKYMRRRGYPQASVTLGTRPEGNGIVYVLKVNEGDPCIVDRTTIGFKLPPGLKFDVAPGDLCDLEEIEAAAGNLETSARDKGYSQVKLQLEPLDYHAAQDTATVVVSGVLGQKMRYEIIDSSHRFLIDDLFGDEELTKIDPQVVGPDAMDAELARRYANRGFVDAKIRGPQIRRVGDDEFVYSYFVDPGKQYVLSSVQFEGVTVFKQDELLSTMGLQSLWQTSRPYNYEEIQQGLTALRARYQQAGYWDAKVRDPGAGQRDREAGTVRLTIEVDEGVPRLLHTVSVTGNHALPASEIVDMLGVEPGKPLDRAKLVDLEKQIRDTYLHLGFLYADVQITLKATAEKHAVPVDVAVAVKEGTRVRIGDVSVSGLARTKEKVVRRELLFQTGDWYDPDKINQSRQALTRLGLFRSVQIAPADRNAVTDKDGELDMIVDVREGKAGNVSFGPGWSLVTGWNYDAEASYNNVGGAGRTVTVRGSISEERDQYAIGDHTLLGRKIGAGYLEPYVLDLPVDARVKVSQEALWYNQLWQITDGGELALIHKLRALPGSSVSAFYGQKIARSEGTDTELQDQVANDERIGQVGLRLNLDKRDNLKFPTGGYTLDAEAAWARYDLGGDVRFFRWDIGTSYYYAFFDTLVLALNVDLTSFENVERKGSQVDALPSPERLASGGADTVRGFPAGSLGPVVSAPVFSQDSQGCHVNYVSTPIDGTSRSTIKTELRHKISESVAITGFVDNGNTWLSPSQLNKFQQDYTNVGDPGNNSACRNVAKQPRQVEDNFNYSYTDVLKHPRVLWEKHYWGYGSSVNLLTPLGAINFAYGLPWHEPESDACKSLSAPVPPDACNIREHQTSPWIKRGEFIINVGARF